MTGIWSDWGITTMVTRRPVSVGQASCLSRNDGQDGRPAKAIFNVNILTDKKQPFLRGRFWL